MKLPVAGVVGFVSSPYAIWRPHLDPGTSLPTALGAGRSEHSPRLARALAAPGVEADDIALVSKHDTSTGANGPNESELHASGAHWDTPGNFRWWRSREDHHRSRQGQRRRLPGCGPDRISPPVAPGSGASLDVVDARCGQGRLLGVAAQAHPSGKPWRPGQARQECRPGAEAGLLTS